MILSDLHVHTCFCDGENTPEEMVLSAIDKGMECIGICAHSYTSFDESYCLKKSRITEFIKEISYLKEKYKDKIKVLCGLEKDYYSDQETDGFDYLIGSVHYLKNGDEYSPIDENPEIFSDICKKHYDGDFYLMAEDYFKTVSKIRNVDYIGHFDLITKYNKDGRFFDEENERYVKAYKKAADILLENDSCFEINTAPIYKGLKDSPYPDHKILEYLKEKGAKFILSSDSHNTDTLMMNFCDIIKIL